MTTMNLNFSDIADILSAIGALTTTVAMLYAYIKDKASRKLFIRLIRPKPLKPLAQLYKTRHSTKKRTPFIVRVAYVINFSLTKSIIMALEAPFEASDKSKKANTIVGLLLMEKMKKSFTIIILLLLSVLIDLGFQQFSNYHAHGYVPLIAVGLWSAIMLDHKIIELRIRKGWYGKNEFEAREIINFALAHANKDDFNDQGGLKRIVPLPDIPEAETSSSRAWGTHS